jgi:hypothetical protein
VSDRKRPHNLICAFQAIWRTALGGGYETEIPHQLAGVLKARQIADLGQHRHCRNEIYPAHRLQGCYDLGKGPLGHRVTDRLLQTLDTLALLAHRPQKLFERNTLLAMLELLQHEPIQVGQPPRLLARIMSPEPTLKDAIAATDGLLLVTPEYNNSIPGIFKNAIDWLSRPPSDIPRVFSGKPLAIIGASPGGFGTILSQEAWLPAAHIGDETLVWWTPACVSRGNRLRRRRGDCERQHQRTASTIHPRICELRAEHSRPQGLMG